MKKLCILFLVSLVLLASCATVGNDVSKNDISQGGESSQAVSSDQSSQTVSVDRGESLLARGDLMQLVSAKQVEGKQIDEAFRQSQMRLAMELFEACSSASEGKNVLISPLSIQLALAMTANGASGETLEEMQALLGGDIPLDELNAYLYEYVGSLPSSDKYKVELANSIWFREQNGFEVYESFLQTNADYYKSQAYAAPFDDTTVEQINKWVEVHTDGMIKKVIEDIDPLTMMYLINALVFDAEWASPYDEYSVHDGTFTALGGRVCDVEYMSAEEGYYLETKDAVGFAKNYKDGKYRFAALLPDEGVDVYDYIASLDGETLLDALDNMESASVFATMPKFSYEYDLEMTDVLSALGMPTAFTDGADFSAMSNHDLHIGTVIHKTFIEVAEKGTRAGAVTAVGMMEEGVPMYKAVIKLDRPFVYLIIDAETNLPLFVGAVTEL
ncbi:MAG: serpin family protein [Clostridia bacterium]|nr:serpin family protein [Clostridia bacterium]